MRDPRYDLLFEPVQIGPVRTKNRFFQVPHCNGMGHVYPQTLARMRGIKAEGGWALFAPRKSRFHRSPRSRRITRVGSGTNATFPR